MDVVRHSHLTGAATIKAEAGLLYGCVLAATGAANVTLSDDADAILVLRLAGAGTVVWTAPAPVAFGTSLKLAVGAGTVAVSTFYV